MPSERRTPSPDLDDRVVRTALMSLPSASVLLVDKDLRYRAAVGAAITYYGFDPAKMVGRLVSDTLSPDALEFVEPALRRAMAGEMFTEIREIKALGGAAFEMAYGPAVEDGEIVGALVVVRDVTVEHRALTDLAASRRAAPHADEPDQRRHRAHHADRRPLHLGLPVRGARARVGVRQAGGARRSTTSSTPRTSTRSAPPVSPCSASASRRA